MGRMFCRHWMGKLFPLSFNELSLKRYLVMEHQSICGARWTHEMAAIGRICGKFSDLLLWVHECIPRAFGCLGIRMECARFGTYFHHDYVSRRWIGKFTYSLNEDMLIAFSVECLSNRTSFVISSTQPSNLNPQIHPSITFSTQSF